MGRITSTYSASPGAANGRAGRTIIRPLQEADLPAAAVIHQSAFADSALTKLGVEATRRYYHWLLTGPHDQLASAAVRDGKLVGFCFSGVFRGATTGFLARNRGYLVRRVLTHPWMIMNPMFRDRLNIANRLLRARRKQIAPVPPPQDAVRSFNVLAIATDPRVQRTGAGRLLMDEAEAVARQLGYSLMKLTVHPENYGAIGFYEHLGWSKLLVGGEWHGVMSKEIEPQARASGDPATVRSLKRGVSANA